MVNLNRTLELVRGGLFDSEATWNGYREEAGDWQKTAILLLGPLIIVAAVAGYVFGFLGSSVSIFGQFRPTLMSTVGTIITSAIGAVVFALVVSALAGMFGGKKSFALGLAATAFASIPSYLGQALMWLPWVGGLIAFALFIYALVLLWKVIPVFLEVPDAKRAAHYIASLVATIVVMMILSLTIGRFFMPSISGPSFSSTSTGGSSSSPFDGGGMLGGFARQAELLDAAENDRYSPPSDGRVDKKQVQEFVRVMERAEEIRQEKMDRYKAIAEKAEEDQDLSLKDLGSLMGGVSEVAGLQTIEIEVVKTAGGNWAEHQWVRESLRAAWIQRDGNDAIEHNYELFQNFEEQLSPFIN